MYSERGRYVKNIYMDTTTDHFSPLAQRVRGNYAPPSLRVIRVAKGQRANVTYVRTIINIYRNSRLNRPDSVSLASLARQ